MKKKWISILCIAGIALSLVLGGCGSASDSSGAADTMSDTSFAMNAESSTVSTDLSETAPTEQDKISDSSEQLSSSHNKVIEAAGGGQGIQTLDTSAGLNKKLIYRANVVMEVKDYGYAQSEIRNLVAMSGGYIVEFTENQSKHEQGGTIILKVPSSGFSSFLDRLEKLEHESMQRGMQGQDVSEEYVDLESRLKVKQAMESRYLQFLKEATKSSQMVEFANELERIQTEIERIRGRMRYIDQNVAYSTIEIRLYQPEVNQVNPSAKGTEPLGKRAWNALNDSLQAIAAVFQWLVVILSGALPILLLLGIIAVPIWIMNRKRILKVKEYRLQRKNTVNPHAETIAPEQAKERTNKSDDDHKEDTDSSSN
ncbi:DUF4349 domain-containing protein [Paenibacillus lentus]|uniref:DUF4349 domain-containing protein n=1 Tax=Paenibacillus lentus TaxID=1338368 RepID=A0A3Q8S617_9BACL|nr:DUF4349 domain-containing protein [Paenibacillus lentus]AZK47872.1 DUF4349 domain-containing protein [Paenibacillus lentus]